MIKRSVLTGIVTGISESITRFVLEIFSFDKEKSIKKKTKDSLTAQVLKKRKAKQDKIGVLLESALANQEKESNKIQKRFEKAQKKHRTRKEQRKTSQGDEQE